jgi:aspartate/methionine/tyrosine aminotransferase
MTPPIPKAQAWIKQFPATSSRPLLNLSQGVPAEAPEKIFTDRISELSKQREPANYGSIQGDDGLREAVKEEMRDVYRWNDKDAAGVGVVKDQIAISAGCNQAFYLTMSALCAEGDEVIIPCPWVRVRGRHVMWRKPETDMVTVVCLRKHSTSTC